MTSPRSVVIGAAGQDGYYLTLDLLKRNHQVTAVVRQEVGRDRYIGHANLNYVVADAAQPAELTSTLIAAAPDNIFHLSAVHGPASTSYEEIWPRMLSVNTGSLHTALEYLRQYNAGGWCFYASSVKVFEPLTGLVSEGSAKTATDLYSITKKASTDLLAHYRSKHNIACCAAHFFQHESRIRDSGYFSAKLAQILRTARKDPSHAGELYTLDFFIDMGSAPEYMGIVADLCDKRVSDELIIATGETVYAKNLAKDLFAAFNMDFQKHIRLKQPASYDLSSSALVAPFTADISKLESYIGHKPKQRPLDVMLDIVDPHQDDQSK